MPKETRTARRLRNLRVKRIDLVDRGANFDPETGEGARVLLYKRDPSAPKEETMQAMPKTKEPDAEDAAEQLAAPRCRACGNALTRGKPFCADCGARVSQDDTASKSWAGSAIQEFNRRISALVSKGEVKDGAAAISKIMREDEQLYRAYRYESTAGSATAHGDPVAEVLKRAGAAQEQHEPSADDIARVMRENPELYRSYRLEALRGVAKSGESAVAKVASLAAHASKAVDAKTLSEVFKRDPVLYARYRAQSYSASGPPDAA